jgi:hypothetical protein
VQEFVTITEVGTRGLAAFSDDPDEDEVVCEDNFDDPPPDPGP